MNWKMKQPVSDRQFARSLAREEATVINGRTKKGVNDAIKQIRSQYSDARLEPLVADVSESSAGASAISATALLPLDSYRLATREKSSGVAARLPSIPHKLLHRPASAAPTGFSRGS